MVNWEFFDNQTPESASALVDDLRAGRAGHPHPRAGSAVHLAAGVPHARRVRRRPAAEGLPPGPPAWSA